MKGIRLVAIVVILACADAPAARIVGPDQPVFELVFAEERISPKVVNVNVLGTFQVLGGATKPRVLGLGKEEPAHFPGNPPNGPGTCLDGRWFNSKGQATSGTPENPHPHCWDPGSDGMTIVLEPIPAELEDPDRSGDTWLHLSHYDATTHGIYVRWVAAPTDGTVCKIGTCLVMRADGTVWAYAIDAATGVRVGMLKFTFGELMQPTNPITENLFDCSLSGDRSQDGCLDLILTANYHPLPPEQGGAGSAQTVSGFLYWRYVTAP